MNKIAVVYESKYGSTKKYAQWLAQELSCKLFEKKDVKAENLRDCDVVVYGGGLYAGGVSGIDFVTKSFESLKDKKWILFTCGLADPGNEENVRHIREVLNHALTPQMQKEIKVFHLRGAIAYQELSIVHRAMMSMLHKMLLKKEKASLTQEDKQMLETYGKTVDFTDRRTLEPIAACIREWTVQTHENERSCANP